MFLIRHLTFETAALVLCMTLLHCYGELGRNK